MATIIPMNNQVISNDYVKHIKKALNEEPIVRSFNSNGKTFYTFETTHIDVKKLANEFHCPIIYFRETKYDDETVYVWDIDEEILLDDINSIDN